MFENQQREDIEALIESNKAFRRAYQRHQQLDNQVHEAEAGALPMDETAISALKRKKLYFKDEMQRLWDERAHPVH